MSNSISSESLTAVMARVRPTLHRYCARMMGSVFDGEDVVQEALTKAAQALPTAGHIDNIERWIFTIAHNTALDGLRRRKTRGETAFAGDASEEADQANEVESWIAASASLATLMQLPVIQRSAVVLVDVLEHSVEESAEILNSTRSAVKAALHRARVRLRSMSHTQQPDEPEVSAEELARLKEYADRFNARDFAALRELLAEDVELDLVNRIRLSGRTDVSVYFGRYSETSDWSFSVGIAEGHPALLVSAPGDPSNTPTYVVLLGWTDGRIRTIRDFRFAKYIVDGLAFHTQTS